MPQKLLIIDDSPSIPVLVRAALANERLEISWTPDGAAGIEQVTHTQPDVVLLDVDIPDPDGFEVCRRLKSDPKTMHVPIVFLSGESAYERKVQGLDLGAVDYVTKPFDPAEFRARVRAALRTKYLLDLLATEAMIDGLTGLWNRRHFEQRLASEIALAQRTSRSLTCIFADVDHLKSVNDTFGHTFGDTALRRIAGVLKEGARISDVVCRYGGEEFAILLPETTATCAAELAERLRLAVQGIEFVHRDQPVQCTCSFGVADVSSGASMVEVADAALYAAKRAGRNSVAIAPNSVAA